MAGQVDVILGSPGAGKTLQADRLALSRRYVHFSTGALLRANATSEVQDKLDQGELVPSQDIEGLLLTRLQQAPADLPILLDGFPRLKDEVKWLDGVLGKLGRTLGHVIYLKVGQAEAKERLSKRGRADDSAKSEAERWHEFEHKTKPVLDYYGHHKQLLEINGTGTPDQVTARILEAL